MRMHLFARVIAIGSLAACASGGSKPAASAPSTSATSNAATAPRRGSANLIVQAEIEGANVETIYDVIERVRPNMLRTRGQVGGASRSGGGAVSTIKVYLNGSLVGDTSALRNIQANSVKQVEFYSASDATTRFGTGHDAGAIIVTSK